VLHDLDHLDPVAVVRERAGGGFDLAVVDLFLAHAEQLAGGCLPWSPAEMQSRQ
jgi:hypothetical protein